MKTMFHVGSLLLVTSVAMGSFKIAGKEKKPPHVNASTIQERVANSRYNQPLKKEAIIFPHLHIRGVLNGPKMVSPVTGHVPRNSRASQ